jgi:hypothetical protein
MLLDDYHYYRIDELDALGDANWFWAACDDDAIAKVRATHPGRASQIWQRKRFVAKLSPQPFDPDDPELQRAVGERLSALALRIRLGKEDWGDAVLRPKAKRRGARTKLRPM